MLVRLMLPDCVEHVQQKSSGARTRKEDSLDSRSSPTKSPSEQRDCVRD